MKSIFKTERNVFVLTCFFSIGLLIAGCYEDKGNYDYSELNEITIEKLETTYRIDFQEVLSIKPVVTTTQASDYDYYWLLIDNQSNQECDTLSREKDLNYTVRLTAGSYKLVFRIVDKQTGLMSYTETNLEVASHLSDGWIVLKDNGTITDIDLFTYEGEKYSDLIQSVNDETIQGTARDIGFMDWITYDSQTLIQTHTKSLMIMSSKDIKVISANDMKIMMRYNDLFYDLPEVCNPQKMYNQAGYNSKIFINDGDLYSSPGTGMFSPPFQNVYLTGDKVSTNCAVSASSWNGFYVNGFNETKGTIVKWDMEGTEYTDRMGLSNMRCLQIYDNGYNGIGYLLQDKETDSLFVYKNTSIDLDTLPDKLNIATSNCMGSNRELPYIYFSKGSRLWMLDLSLKVEKEVDFDFGEGKITFIAHTRTPLVAGKNKLIVATYSANGYKVYLFNLLSGMPDGTPQILEGNGRVADVFHQSFYNASGAFYSYPDNY